LTLFDFLLWGYIQNYIYTDKIRDVNFLKVRTREASEKVTRDIYGIYDKKWNTDGTYVGAQILHI
jgi:hypothetical protein